MSYVFGGRGGYVWFLSTDVLEDLEEGEPGEWLEAVEVAEESEGEGRVGDD